MQANSNPIVFSILSLEFTQTQLTVFLMLLFFGIVLGFLLGYLLRSLSASRQIYSERELRITTQAKLKHQDLLDQERDTALSIASQRLESTFQDLATHSLKNNNAFFLQLAEQKLNNQQNEASNQLEQRKNAIQQLIKPIGEALQKTEQQIENIEKDRQTSIGELNQRLTDLSSTHENLRVETRNLVKALRKPEVRGRWGEQSLRRLVELSGMVANCDFNEQVSVVTENGRIRPDMIVTLPDQRQIIVDAKTPLQAYLDAIESTDKAEQQTHLTRHLNIIKAHISQLAAKDYWMEFTQAPEFVVMFIPGEQFLAAAMDLDHQLFDYALQKNIILATPNNFMALLKTINYGWKQVHLAHNAENIKSIAETLYKRLIVFTEHLHKMGRHLEQTNKSYNQAVGSLERSVLPSARKFTDLGISSNKLISTLQENQITIRKPTLNNKEEE